MTGFYEAVGSKLLTRGLCLAAMFLIWTSQASAGGGCEKIQEGIFQEEMEGDLDAAVKLFQQVVDDPQAKARDTVEARYRMAGCYRKLGKNELAQEQLRAIIEKYPDQKLFVKKAKTVLEELTASEPIKLGPAPWGDKEVLTYDLMGAGGGKLGEIYYSITKAKEDAVDIWQILHEQDALGNQLRLGANVRCDTFQPIKGFLSNKAMGEMTAVYGKDEITLTIEGKKKTQKQIPYTPPIYDNEQVVYMLRRLPLKIGYRVSIPIFTPGGGEILQCIIHVTEKRKQKVPAGTFECYKASLTVKQGEATFLEHDLWYSVEAPHYLVKYDLGTASFELAQIGVKKELSNSEPIKLKPAPWEDKEVLTYEALMPDSQRIDESVFAIAKKKKGAECIWEINVLQDTSSPGGKMRRVDAKCDTFQPVESNLIVDGTNQTRAIFGDDEITVDYVAGEKVKIEKTIPFSPPIYDFGQLFYLPRLLPLEVGYRLCIPVFQPELHDKIHFTLDVIKIEQVKVPSGNYQCFKTSFSMKEAKDSSEDNTFIAWFSVDAPHYLVKFKTSLTTLQLVGIGDKNDDTIKELVEKKSGKKASSRDRVKSRQLAAKGWQLWTQQNLPAARRQFIEALKADPRNDNAWQGIGWVYMNQGKRDLARESFDICIQLNPKNSAALNGLGWLARGAGNFDEAIAWWEKAVEANPEAIASLNGLTQTFMDQEEYANAVKYYKKWLKAEPNSEAAKEGLREAQKKMKK